MPVKASDAHPRRFKCAWTGIRPCSPVMPMYNPSPVATTKYTIASRYQTRVLLDVLTAVSTIPPWCLTREKNGRSIRPSVKRYGRLNAATVLAGTRVDFDPVAGSDEQRHLHLQSARELGGLQHLTRSVTTDGRLGVRDLAHDRVGKLDRNRLALVKRQLAFDAVLEVVRGVADAVLLDLDLVVVAVHENVHRIGVVREGHRLLLKLDHIELFIGAIHALGAGARKKIPQLHLDDGRVAAGFVEFRLLHDHRVLADHDHIAGTDFLRGFHCSTRY